MNSHIRQTREIGVGLTNELRNTRTRRIAFTSRVAVSPCFKHFRSNAFEIREPQEQMNPDENEHHERYHD